MIYFEFTLMMGGGLYSEIRYFKGVVSRSRLRNFYCNSFVSNSNTFVYTTSPPYKDKKKCPSRFRVT